MGTSKSPLVATADCVGAMYEAASGNREWRDVGGMLLRLLGAHRVSLSLPNEQGQYWNLLQPRTPGGAAYAQHYFRLDPFRIAAERDFRRNGPASAPVVRLGTEIVDDDSYLRSEYYSDFGRHVGQRHLLSGMLGRTTPTPIGFLRPEDMKPFEDPERDMLRALLPHLQQSLILRERLAKDIGSDRLSAAVLDTMSVGVMIVDRGGRIAIANAAAGKLLNDRNCSLSTTSSGSSFVLASYLCAAGRRDNQLLHGTINAAANGDPGGVLRLRLGEDGNRNLAVIIAPAPMNGIPGALGPVDPFASRPVLVVLQELFARLAPSATLLCDLFGFSRAEAEVAVTLIGGTTAETVARQRQVSLSTVRAQIQSILTKSEALNLRDFERTASLLAAISPLPHPGALAR